MKSAERSDFAGGTVFAEIEADTSTARKLAELFESDPRFKRFALQVRTDSKTKIVAVAKG